MSLVHQWLRIVVYLCVTFSLFSCLDIGKQISNSLERPHFVSVTWFSFTTRWFSPILLCHSRSVQTSAKDDGHTGASVDCTSYFLLICFTAAEKHSTCCAEDHLVSAWTSRHFCLCDANELTIPLRSSAV